MTKKPVIFLTFANDRKGQFLEALEPERTGLHHQLSKYLNTGEGIYHSAGSSDPKDLLKDLNLFTGQIRVFHFSGHSDGVNLQLENNEGEEQYLHGKNLVKLLKSEVKNSSQLFLVFLNACNSKGLLKALQHIEVPAIIATDTTIPDKTARDFSISFYRSLVSGNNLETAFDNAKIEIASNKTDKQVFRAMDFSRKNTETDDIPWGLYVQQKKCPHSEAYR